jgi:hypothetical protein
MSSFSLLPHILRFRHDRVAGSGPVTPVQNLRAWFVLWRGVKEAGRETCMWLHSISIPGVAICCSGISRCIYPILGQHCLHCIFVSEGQDSIEGLFRLMDSLYTGMHLGRL